MANIRNPLHPETVEALKAHLQKLRVAQVRAKILGLHPMWDLDAWKSYGALDQYLRETFPDQYNSAVTTAHAWAEKQLRRHAAMGGRNAK